MDEVDKIILLTLRQLGTDVEEDVASLADLPTKAFVEGAARCINTINGNDEMPLSLPGSMAARFRVGTTLATACQDLGYGSNIGYNTFLYSNEDDCRQLLMWLIERLPKETTSTTGAETLGQEAMLQRAITAEIDKQLSCPWIPPAFHRDGLCWSNNRTAWHLISRRGVRSFRSTTLFTSEMDAANTARAAYETTNQQTIPQQRSVATSSLASILARNSRLLASERAREEELTAAGRDPALPNEDFVRQKRTTTRRTISAKVKAALFNDAKQEVDMAKFLAKFSGIELGKMSMFRAKHKLQFAKEDEAAVAATKTVTDEELKQQREDELSALQGEVEDLESSLQAMRDNLASLQSTAEALAEQTARMQEENEALTKEQKVRKRVLDLLPNAEENMQLLKDKIDEVAAKLAALAERWEEHRVALIKEYRDLKVAAANKNSEARKQAESIQELRSQAKQIIADAKQKEQLFQQLVQDYERMNKDILRSSYTSRILEIVKSIDKQKREIQKILVETRGLQKDLGLLEGKIERTFTVAEEEIFKESKANPAARLAYKHLANLHAECGRLIDVVKSTGTVAREIRDLEDQIEVEQRKDTQKNLDRISADLKALKTENKQLAEQLRKK
ncbi:hypothetical protein PTSG_03231 [Salpingoeca rosetta]|uniref:Coiled-coil domain-containing protein 22 homolog n=1 Tax=Salpingoeca rosetta (strain ATCC 50818 / BSB-021) TaxID=946362 RepID=F2U4L3_SALR5|nr:uncharacterized protein PTSG_03231 [Salpingoeca rosetta]EGD82579.1 hypothetical protein PTSG_03231 [Salpingoeca rosetta]|eukprot:XP_004995815.1 hypothetical protein PTSG_03231 [Salpingoeca rosetta]